MQTNRDAKAVPRTGEAMPNAEHRYEVTLADLPVHCPLPEMSLWNSHPRVYIHLKEPGQTAICPYCGAEFVLKE